MSRLTHLLLSLIKSSFSSNRFSASMLLANQSLTPVVASVLFHHLHVHPSRRDQSLVATQCARPLQSTKPYVLPHPHIVDSFDVSTYSIRCPRASPSAQVSASVELARVADAAGAATVAAAAAAAAFFASPSNVLAAASGSTQSPLARVMLSESSSKSSPAAAVSSRSDSFLPGFFSQRCASSPAAR